MLEAQIWAIVDNAGFSSICQLLINLPEYAPAAFVLPAKLHQCIGHVPVVLHLRALVQSPPTRLPSYSTCKPFARGHASTAVATKRPDQRTSQKVSFQGHLENRPEFSSEGGRAAKVAPFLSITARQRASFFSKIGLIFPQKSICEIAWFWVY